MDDRLPVFCALPLPEARPKPHVSAIRQTKTEYRA
jgi:hypothetical protein